MGSSSTCGGPDASEGGVRETPPAGAAGRPGFVLLHPTGKPSRGAVTSYKRFTFLNHRPPIPTPSNDAGNGCP